MRYTTTFAPALMFGIVTVLAQACRAAPPERQEPGAAASVVVGGLYGVSNGDGTYSIVKVLVVDEFAVHLRAYANKFGEIPMDIDPVVLTLGGIDDPAGLGIGHFPLAKEGFWQDNPVFIKQVLVEAHELDGYRVWLESTK